MQNVIDKIQGMIVKQSSPDMTESQRYYITGLADALQVIEDYMNEKLTVGKSYYVIMFKEPNHHFPYIDYMRCYKISEKGKPSYCFTRSEYGKFPSPDLVLYSKSGLARRVFDTKESAELGKSCYWS